MENIVLTDVVRELKEHRTEAQRQITRLDEAIRVLSELGTNGASSRPKRTMSAAARQRIAKAQRLRWAKVKKEQASKKVGVPSR